MTPMDEGEMARARRAAAAVEREAAARAAELDRHGAFPQDDVAALHAAGLLTAPLPARLGGLGLCEPGAVATLRDVLAAVGRGSLPLGRLYEGHVNALALVLRYGAPATVARLAEDARIGHLFGVWNTEPAEGGLAVRDEAGHLALTGAKSFASGAGYVTRPLVTARRPDGRGLMLVVPLDGGARADIAGWRAQGMRATATGTLDFTGLTVGPADVIGEPDDYGRQPFFSAGAWRFLAVQLGGIEAVFEAHRAHLQRTGRGGDPHQRARLGEAAAAVATAALHVERAAAVAAAEDGPAERVVALVNLARTAVERAGLDVIALAQRSVGLPGFLETHPLERLVRDLGTYLRQPGPDHAVTSAAETILADEAPLRSLWRTPSDGA